VLGKIVDVLVEDDTWQVRYFVIGISNTFPQRRVLLSPEAIGLDHRRTPRLLSVLTVEQLLSCPQVDWDMPISRQYEKSLREHFGWPLYWLGSTVTSTQQLNNLAGEDVVIDVTEGLASNLRSLREICGYKVLSRNGQAGRMKDLVINPDTWQVELAVSEPTSWLAKQSCMFSTGRIRQIDWATQVVMVDLEQETLLATQQQSMPWYVAATADQ
jgi:sporulation protein YlmC with PRC-barrel domain